jgi:hypothetical protein
VNAHGADFGEAIEPHALSCHGDQHPLTANPNVLPEFNRARTERPRMCGFHKRQHVRDVTGVQLDNRHAAGVRGHLNQNHLIDGGPLDYGKGCRRHHLLKRKEANPITCGQKGEQ